MRDDVRRCADLGADELIVNATQITQLPHELLDLTMSLAAPVAVGA